MGETEETNRIMIRFHPERKSLRSQIATLKREEWGSPEHIDQSIKIFAQNVHADLATLIDSEGKEVGREIIFVGQDLP